MCQTLLKVSFVMEWFSKQPKLLSFFWVMAFVLKCIHFLFNIFITLFFHKQSPLKVNRKKHSKKRSIIKFKIRILFIPVFMKCMNAVYKDSIAVPCYLEWSSNLFYKVFAHWKIPRTVSLSNYYELKGKSTVFTP